MWLKGVKLSARRREIVYDFVLYFASKREGIQNCFYTEMNIVSNAKSSALEKEAIDSEFD